MTAQAPDSRARVVFLLGAGVSVGAGLPTTSELTRSVLTARPPQVPPSRRQVVEERATDRLLEHLGEIAGPGASYEDIYFLLRQITEEGVEYENPFVRGSILAAAQASLHGSCAPIGATRARDHARGIADRAMERIRSNLVRELGAGHPVRAGHLGPLLAACRDGRLAGVDIITLNHDVMIERALVGEGLAFDDGFHGSRGLLREWRHGQLACSTERIRLIKLHGSLDWRRVRPRAGDKGWHADRLIQIDIFDGSPLGLDAMPPAPLLLIGTTDKISDYVRFPYVEQLIAARDALARSDRLVISGYSFRDHALNGLVAEWYYRAVMRRIVCCAPDVESALDQSRSAIQGKWRGWLAAGSLALVDAPFANASWDQVALQLAVE